MDTLETHCVDFLSKGNGEFEFGALWNLDFPFGATGFGSSCYLHDFISPDVSFHVHPGHKRATKS